MKSVLKSVLVLGALLSTSAAFSADLTGTWNVGTTKCLSGAPLAPGVTPPTGTFVFTATTMTMNLIDQGCSIVVGPAAVTITNDQITPNSPAAPVTFTCPGQPAQSGEGTLSATSYTLNGDVLTLKAGPEGADSACPAGDFQIVDLSKAK